jgi:hypothetical protein
MYKLTAILLLSVSAISVAAADGRRDTNWWDWDWGGGKGDHFNVPEIDPGSAISALTLLVGGVTVLRSRIGKK